jgi:hypothetical protein
VKSLLIICDTDLSKDPRVLRQVKALKGNFNITTCGVSPTGEENTFYSIYPVVDYHFKYPVVFRKIVSLAIQLQSKFRKFTRPFILSLRSGLSKNSYYEKKYWTIHRIRLANVLKKLNPDVIIANDISTLPLAGKLKSGKTKLVFDAHEYHPEELNEIESWRTEEKPAVIFFLKKYLPAVDLMLTVSQPIADKYSEEFNVKPIIITNAPGAIELEPKEPGSKIKLIHHGGAIKERLLEETINVMNFLDERYTLDLILVATDKTYLDYLKDKYKNDIRIKFLAPVPTSEISRTINQYDIGIYILPPLNFNNINALPNKFFEFIQARLAVAIGPMPAMAGIVNQYNLGVVADDYKSESLAKAIQQLSHEKLFSCKKNSSKAAKDLNAEINMEILKKEIANLVN